MPLDQIDTAWSLIEAESPHADEPVNRAIENFRHYFVKTWLQNDSIFPRRLWNHYKNFGARTTNHIEGWHQGLNRIVKKSHVNLFELITHLKNQEAVLKADILVLRMGQKPPPISKKYMTLNTRLINFVEELEANRISLIEYVRGVGANNVL